MQHVDRPSALEMDRRATAIARSQHGLIARRQAIELGLDDGRIRSRLRSGRWTAVRPGVYEIGAAPTTWEQRVLAQVLAAGTGAVASHRTAARLWNLVDRSGRIEILIPHERRVRLSDVQVHRSRLLVAEDADIRRGIPVTSLDRTIADVAPRQSTEVIGRWIDAGRRDHELDLVRLAATCSRLTVPGHVAPRSAMQALALRADGYDPGRSALESRALAAIAQAGLPAPVRQHVVERSPGRRAFIDLAYPDVLLAIELDGWETHGVRAAFDEDRVRANDLALLGWTVLRFTWSMDDAYLCETVRRALADRRPATGDR